MEIILKDDVKNLGQKDDILKVKDGYARNCLIPKGLAINATESAKKVHAENLRQRAHKEEKIKNAALELSKQIEAVNLVIGAKTSTTGKIFGSVNTIMISEALAKKGFNVDRKVISLKENEDGIKEVGKYKANIKLHRDVKVEIEFEVISE
jgi:large subunit ribosomal protein L9